MADIDTLRIVDYSQLDVFIARLLEIGIGEDFVGTVVTPNARIEKGELLPGGNTRDVLYFCEIRSPWILSQSHPTSHLVLPNWLEIRYLSTTPPSGYYDLLMHLKVKDRMNGMIEVLHPVGEIAL